MEPVEPLITTMDAARVLGVGPDRIRQLADDGQLPFLRTESGWRVFRRVDVEKLAAERADAARSTTSRR